MLTGYLREQVTLELEIFILNECDIESKTECKNDQNQKADPDISNYEREQVVEKLTNFQITKIKLKTIYINNCKIINDLGERVLKNILD